MGYSRHAVNSIWAIVNGFTRSPVVTSEYWALPWEIIPVNPTGGALTIHLPTDTLQGDQIIVINITSSTNTITLDGDGALIEGAATYDMVAPYECRYLIWSGARWELEDIYDCYMQNIACALSLAALSADMLIDGIPDDIKSPSTLAEVTGDLPKDGTASAIKSVTTLAKPIVNGFVTEWTVAGDAAARTITLPLIETRTEGALAYDCYIDWGDGSAVSNVTAFDDADRAHTYASDGTYRVNIWGTMEGWSFNNGGDKLKITKVITWGDIGGPFAGFKYLKGGFFGCANLTAIGTGPIPASGTGLGTDGFSQTFKGCVGTTSVPTDLIRYHTAVTTLYQIFHDCTNITTIPVDLFRYNVAVTNMGYMFCSCNKLASIPADIFRYNTEVTSFTQALLGCSVPTSMPADLFRYNTKVTNFSFVLDSCSGLTALPTNLFRYNTLVTDFSYALRGLTALTSVQEDLFRYNTVATSFVSALQNCNKLQQNDNIFYEDGAQATRFNGKTVDFTNCFARSSFTGTQGVAPDLWNCAGTLTGTDCWDGAGNSLTSLSNYGDIPVGWL